MNGFNAATRAALQEAQQQAWAKPLPWLNQLQRAAAARYDAEGLPALTQEQWKYTNLAALSAATLRPALSADSATLSAAAFAALALATDSRWRAVVVNGGFRGDLATLHDLPTGIQVRSIAAVLAATPAVMAEALAAAAADSSSFTALNTALLQDGLLIDIADDVVLDQPLHLIFVGAGGGSAAGVIRNPRIIVRAGRHSRVRLIEEYVSAGDDAGLTNCVTDIVLAAGATLHHHRLQTESVRAAHIGRVAVSADRDTSLVSDSIVFGGHLTRVDIDVALRGRGARCRLNGLFVGSGTQHIDHHTRIDHLVGDTHSTELYRGILDQRSRGVFNGKVIVHKDAQHISAEQSSNNLLLSRQAEIDTKPELEIYADDVRCAHGATVGELDRAALFYLRSRGIGEAAARALLTYAFAQKVADDIPLAGVRLWIEQRFLGHHGYGELLAAVREL